MKFKRGAGGYRAISSPKPIKGGFHFVTRPVYGEDADMISIPEHVRFPQLLERYLPEVLEKLIRENRINLEKFDLR